MWSTGLLVEIHNICYLINIVIALNLEHFLHHSKCHLLSKQLKMEYIRIKGVKLKCLWALFIIPFIFFRTSGGQIQHCLLIEWKNYFIHFSNFWAHVAQSNHNSLLSFSLFLSLPQLSISNFLSPFFKSKIMSFFFLSFSHAFSLFSWTCFLTCSNNLFIWQL